MLILSLSSPDVTFENSGGKGANLSRLARHGLAVPAGFILTTQAYRRFISSNQLQVVIAEALAGLSTNDTDQLENTSARIRAAFSSGSLPGEIVRAVEGEYRLLDPQAEGVAVRSSATTEDLPDLSFAGQQDTYLNVIGEMQLIEAVVNCWSSLWTARAIGYRLRNSISHEQASLAVVVQRMVASEVSGVLFTANPLTGLRNEAVIDATFGLGEALVSGQVEPDHYVVDTLSGVITSTTLGGKAVATHLKIGGGVVTTLEEATTRQALSDPHIQQLATTGQAIQHVMGSPQDIEWAFAGGELFILQSRPITSLFPVPEISFDPLKVWFSFGAFQGVVGPMTPLGQEVIQRIFLGVATKMKIKVNYESQNVLVGAAERLWVKVSDLIRNSIGVRVLMGALGIGEPEAGLILWQLVSDPRLAAGKGRIRISTLRRLIAFILPALVNLPRSLLYPEKARRRFDARLEGYLQSIHIPPGGSRFERLANAAAFIDSPLGVGRALPYLLQQFMPLMAPSLASLYLIGRLLPQNDPDLGGGSTATLEITHSLPGNVTTEMDLALWAAAQQIKQNPGVVGAFLHTPAPALAGLYLGGTLPGEAQSAISYFLDRYGMRGTGEIDIGQPRWRDDPLPILLTLQSYLQIAPEAAPDLRFEAGAREAETAIQEMANTVRRLPGGRLKERLLLASARRVRLLLGARESPKFCLVRMLDILRKVLLEAGAEFAAIGTFKQPTDVFFLHSHELVALARGEERDWNALVSERREGYQRELHRRQVPRVLLSDGRTFYQANKPPVENEDQLTGSPVSPGVVEGTVRVVFDPRSAHLMPGEILVCPGTDPAWTPLFMAAGGLVMEVGGMMTHGSVVAREYGIPAVVGVIQATSRLKDGQCIRVDGGQGRITILEK